MQRTELTKKTAKYKGFTALGSATATALLTFLSPSFLVLGVPMTLWFVFRWLQYRAKWGLRF